MKEEVLFMKKKVGALVWLTVPLLVVVGCSSSSRDSSVSYSPTLTEPVSPTSDRDAARIYANQGATVSTTSVPKGASSQDWQIAEEVRALLSADPKLGNAPMAAVVNNGVVTLRGDVRNKKDRQRLHDQIAALPGVVRVDDQMDFRNPLETIHGETKSY